MGRLREAAARQLLRRTWCELDNPRAVPVATAAAELLNPEAAHPSPADQIWLPLDNRNGHGGARRKLHRLLDAWPHVPMPTADSESDEAVLSDSPLTVMAAAPAPMPPAHSHEAPRVGRAPVSGEAQ